MMKISWNSAATSQPSVLCSLTVPSGLCLPPGVGFPPSQTVFTVTQLWEYTNHCLVNFTLVRFMGMRIPPLKLREENEVGLAHSKCSIKFVFPSHKEQFSKGGLQISSINITQELIRNANTLRWGPAICFNDPLSVVHTQAAAPFRIPTGNV